MKQIPLTQGQYAKVSDEDFQELSKYAWRAVRVTGRGKSGKIYYYGYKAARKIGNKIVSMHQIIMSPGPGLEVDHVDGDTLNNTRENLRVCTHKQNCNNRGKVNKNTSSQYLGVYWNTEKSKWRVALSRMYVGMSEYEDVAAVMYNAAVYRLNGKHARLNHVVIF